MDFFWSVWKTGMEMIWAAYGPHRTDTAYGTRGGDSLRGSVKTFAPRRGSSVVESHRAIHPARLLMFSIIQYYV